MIADEQLAGIQHDLVTRPQMNLTEAAQIFVGHTRTLLGAVQQLRYERRLLGACRRHLDEIADPEGRYTVDAVKTAGDLAQRIVDEIGHPVTDEPALGPEFRDRIAELERELEWAVAERDHALGQIQKPDYEKLVAAYLAGAQPVAEERNRLQGQIVTLMGIVRGLERFDDYDPASASVTVHAIKQIFGEDGGEPLSRRSLDAATLLWAADELDAQAEAHNQNLIDYTDHLRCFTEQPQRKSIVPLPGEDVPVESAPAAKEDLSSDMQALNDRRATGCAYDTGLCMCPGQPYEYEGCKAPSSGIPEGKDTKGVDHV